MGVPGVSSRVTVDHLTKSYGRLTALSDVSFSIHAGEVLGLDRPQRRRQDDAVRVHGGVLPYESGSVSVDGRPLAPRDRSSFLFYTPDAIAPWPAQTVSWALDFRLGFFGGPAARRDEVIAKLDLEALLGSPLGTFEPMVGTWVVARDGSENVVMVDGRPWVQSKDNPTKLLIENARKLYGTNNEELMDNAKQFAYFPVAIARDVQNFSNGTISMKFKTIRATPIAAPASSST